MLLISLGKVAAKRQQFVCGDTGCDSGIPKGRLSRQFFHTFGCNFRHIAKDRRQSLFTFRYGNTFTFPYCADGML